MLAPHVFALYMLVVWLFDAFVEVVKDGCHAVALAAAKHVHASQTNTTKSA
jgi:hypothetical protein